MLQQTDERFRQNHFHHFGLYGLRYEMAKSASLDNAINFSSIWQ
jgi:hypothetical protein